jgi:hypothetical protein
MGIPYSREINKAFEELNQAYGQVTPLIESAYDVLETTKNISLVLLAIQVLTVLLLGLILLALVGLLITMNPDLDEERKELVTPVLRWAAGWARFGKGIVGWTGVVLALVVIGIVGGVVVVTRSHEKVFGAQEGAKGEGEGEGEEDDQQGDKEEGAG